LLARHRENKVRICCAALSFANGTKRHFAAPQQTVAIGGKADIGSAA